MMPQANGEGGKGRDSLPCHRINEKTAKGPLDWAMGSCHSHPVG